MRKAIRLFSVSAIIAVLLFGCAFTRLKKDLAVMQSTVGIGGTIVNHSPQPATLMVLLYSEAGGKREVRNVKFLSPGENLYFFLVSPGDYRVLAFEDANRNLVYDDGEYFGFVEEPDVIHVSRATPIDYLNIEVNRTSQFPGGFPTDISQLPVGRGILEVYDGAVVSLTDPRFSEENAKKGFWQPMTALQEIGTGIYFLAPYDPHKIPVLFVHGAAGTPRNFQSMVEDMDSSRFQPWFFHYPSGFPLVRVSQFLDNMISYLHDRYGFKTLYVTAHSMGGLVARDFILQNVYDGGNDYIKLFVSISSPFGGLETAQKGVESAPAAIPSWYDVVPGSPFIERIFSRSLQGKVDYYLLFSFKGDCSLFMGNNDGSVTLASELDHRAQADAVQQWGFDEGHVDILSSPAVLKYYDNILEKTAARKPSKVAIFGMTN
jgi:pimeloyl-ACP methyl ester carboxylesterase